MKETILVIREFDKFSQLLAENDLEIINLPLIQTLSIEDSNELEAKLINLDNYDGLFLTSPKAAEVFLQRFQEKGAEFGGKVYVLGNRTKALLEHTSFEIVFRETADTAEALINSFEKKEFAGKRFLYLRGDKSLRTIAGLLKNVAEIDEIIVYRTVENAIEKKTFNEIAEKLHQKKINWICFFSPSAIESFIGNFEKKLLNAVNIAVIGTTTAKKAAAENLKVNFISPKADAEHFAVGLFEYLRNG